MQGEQHSAVGQRDRIIKFALPAAIIHAAADHVFRSLLNGTAWPRKRTDRARSAISDPENPRVTVIAGHGCADVRTKRKMLLRSVRGNRFFCPNER
jgi:hypothetical protein